MKQKLFDKCSVGRLKRAYNVQKWTLIFYLIYLILLLQSSSSLKILPKPCSNAIGEQGTCMFVWECIKTEGKHLGTCVDGFLFGSCCAHNDTSNQVDSDNHKIHVKPLYSSLSANYNSEYDYSTTNLINSNTNNYNNINYLSQSTASPSSALLSSIAFIPSNSSYVNFNNSPPNDIDIYHHLNENSFSSSSLIHKHSSSSSNNVINNVLNNELDDHHRPHTHLHSNNSINDVHTHHHPYYHQNYHTQYHQTTTTTTTTTESTPISNSFINFNLINNQEIASSNPQHASSSLTFNRPSHQNQFISTTILPPFVLNYNPFKPADHSYNNYILKNYTLYSIKPTEKPNSFFTFNKTSNLNTNHKPSNLILSNNTLNQKPSLVTINQPSLNGQIWTVHNSIKPSNMNSIFHTFRPPIFNIFRPQTLSYANNTFAASSNTLNQIGNLIYSKPTFRPSLIRPTVSNFVSNNHHYSTRTTPVLSSTQSINSVYNSNLGVTFSSFTSSSYTTTEKPPSLYPPSFNSNSSNDSYFPLIINELNSNSINFAHNLTSSNMINSNSSSNNDETDFSVISDLNPSSPSSLSQSSSSAISQTISFASSSFPSSNILPNNELLPKSNCGSPKVLPHTKVVGGKSAAFGAWPWQVSVRRTSFFGFSSTHRCGGAILSKKWIATAAHCVDDLLMSQIRIRVGEYDFASVLEPYPYQERTVCRKVVHPQYNFFTYENDLALVELDEVLVFQPHIAPICLPEESVQLLGKNATVTGWGRLSEGGVLPSVLQEVKVPIVSNDKCKNMFLNAGRHEYIPDVFMCAGFEHGGHDSCQGDSGGPLQVRGEDGKWFLAGIISWGIGCAEPNLPGVCTRISKFRNWISSVINN